MKTLWGITLKMGRLDWVEDDGKAPRVSVISKPFSAQEVVAKLISMNIPIPGGVH